MNSCKIIAVSIAKGGAGKTTTCVNLGAAIANQGHRVLIADLDPQGHIALAFGINPKTVKRTIANLMYACFDGYEMDKPEDIIIKTGSVHILPSNKKLTSVGDRLAFAKNSEQTDGDTPKSEDVLKTVLGTVKQDYDYIFIDCPPNMSILTRNALVAADSVIIPLETQYYAYEGLKETLDVVSMIKRDFNPSLEIEGILLTKHHSRTNLCRGIKETVESEFGEKIHIFAEPISYSIKAAEQSVNGTSIFEYDNSSSIAKGYFSASKEVLDRGQK